MNISFNLARNIWLALLVLVLSIIYSLPASAALPCYYRPDFKLYHYQYPAIGNSTPTGFLSIAIGGFKSEIRSIAGLSVQQYTSNVNIFQKFTLAGYSFELGAQRFQGDLPMDRAYEICTDMPPPPRGGYISKSFYEANQYGFLGGTSADPYVRSWVAGSIKQSAFQNHLPVGSVVTAMSVNSDIRIHNGVIYYRGTAAPNPLWAYNGRDATMTMNSWVPRDDNFTCVWNSGTHADIQSSALINPEDIRIYVDGNLIFQRASSGFPKPPIPDIVYQGKTYRVGSGIYSDSPESGKYMGAITYSFEVCTLVTNQAPIASNLSIVTAEDTAKSITLSASDPDAGDFHTFNISSGPAVGSVTLSGSTLTFTPPANWSGTTSLSYAALDSEGAWSNTATVTITVNPVNDAPTANAATLNTSEDTAGSSALSGSDVDIPYGDSLSFEVIAQPGQGSASITGSTVNYTPPANWSGATSMTYRAKDLAGAYSPAVTVTINVAAVNDVPVAAAKSITTNEDTAGSVTMSATDIDSPAPTVFQVVSAPANGSASISGSTLTFTPTGDWSGSASLTYRAQDSAGAWSAPVTVTITVNPVNDAPVAVAKSITTSEDTAGSVTLSVVDPDIAYGDSHTFELVGLSANGTEVISGSSLTFTPAADWNGSTSVTYRAKDEAGVYSAAVTVSITVNPVNDAPVSQAKTGSTDEDTPTTLTLTATDIDSPVPAVFQIVAAPNASYGTASITGATLTFTPVANWHGTASMTYRAQDSSGAWSAPVTVTITVISVNDVPAVTASKLSLKTKESKAVTTKYLVSP